MKIHIRTTALLAALLIVPFVLSGQNVILTKDEISKRFGAQLSAFPQEKIHLHTEIYASRQRCRKRRLYSPGLYRIYGKHGRGLFLSQKHKDTGHVFYRLKQTKA